MSERTLLALAAEALHGIRKDPADVLWVGSADGSLAVSWDAFARMAMHGIETGHCGGAVIASDLCIVGADFYLSWCYSDRDGYGFEGHHLPALRSDAKPFHRIGHAMANDARLREINDADRRWAAPSEPNP